jgi:dipeptidase E
MTIFLSGGGSGEKSKNLDLAFINSIKTSKPILYIPLARNSPYDSCLMWIKTNFRQFNFNNFKMIDNPKMLININLSEYSGIYLGGGNTYKLLKELQKSKFISKLKKYIKGGGLVYGGSAGAIILGKDVGTTNSKNEYEVVNCRGLDLIGKFSVYCHYKNEDDQRILNYIKSTKNKVLALPEDAGAILDNSKMRIIGPGNLVLFDKLCKKVIPVNSVIEI